MKHTILILICVLLCSCAVRRRTETITSTDQRIEIRYERIFVHDTVNYEIPVERVRNVTRDTMSRLETKFAISVASVDSLGFLTHTLENKPGVLRVPVEVEQVRNDSIVYRDRSENKTLTKIKEVPRKANWFERMEMWGFWVLLALVIWAYRECLIKLFRKILGLFGKFV